MKRNYVIGLLLVVIIAGLAYGLLVSGKDTLRYVNISINPEIQLAVNQDDEVKEILAINEDADVLLSDLDLIGMNIDDAANEILDEAVETGFIYEYSDENLVLITAIDENEEERIEFEEKLAKTMNEYANGKGIYPIILTKGLNESLKTEALTFEISNGKMLLVDRAASLDSTQTREALAKMSVKEIQQMIKNVITNRHEELKSTAEELKVQWQEEKTLLINANEAKIKRVKDDILEDEVKGNTNKMTDEEKADAVSEIIETKKQEIQENVNEIKDEVNQEPNGKTYQEVKEEISSIKKQNKN